MGIKMKKNQILRICLCAIASSLYVIFDLLSISADPLKITMSGLPIIVIAVIFGPVDGMIVGFCGSFLCQLLNYGFTPTTILWILPAVFRGFYVGILCKKIDLQDDFIKVILIIVSSSLFVTLLNTGVMWIDSVIYGYYSHAYIFGSLLYRIASGLLTGIVYYILTPLIVIPLKKIKFFN